jgi:hypothetical protein
MIQLTWTTPNMLTVAYTEMAPWNAYGNLLGEAWAQADTTREPVQLVLEFCPQVAFDAQLLYQLRESLTNLPKNIHQITFKVARPLSGSILHAFFQMYGQGLRTNVVVVN